MIKVVAFLIALLSVASSAVAQEEIALDRASIMPSMPETHNYTYVVDENGNAGVWLRIDGIKPESTPQTYQFTTPKALKGSVMAWQRENGCLEYKNDICVYYGSTNWKEVEVSLSNQTVSLAIPATRLTGRYGENNTTLGLAFTVENVSDKKWWGRNININSGISPQLVSYINIGVYLPEGVYTRDRTKGPGSWATGIAETLSVAQSRSSDMGFTKAAGSPMLDMAGSGQIYRSRQNIMPNQEYRFSFMSSTSLWKLFYPEIGFGLLWLIAIGTVVALLLRLIIGKKSLKWYLAVIGLLVLLGTLIGGLWFTYRTAFNGSNPGYPMPYYDSGMGGSPAVMEKNIELEPALDVTTTIDQEITPIESEAPAGL